MGYPRRGLDGQDEQAQPDVILRPGKERLQCRKGALRIHVQGYIQCRAERTRHHQATQADDVAGPQPNFMQRATAGVPQA
jgi:hypothetical protein